ncbi:Gfo/Idh/MocA family protein [Salibacterium lacus]|uniref:Gfo/Idh/MocA family protein n=1 Tax=Salibacterium lacus TaxID=1898109 RepID=A0ABW5T3N9_9BACI
MKRYVVCGMSNRALGMFIKPMLKTFSDSCQLVGMLDVDAVRFEVCREQYPETIEVPAFGADEFDRMVEDVQPDAVIVTSRDDTHVDFIVRGLEHNLEVISEKPMAVTAKECRRIIEAEENSSGYVHVTFNYRYNPYHMKIKELIDEGKIGRVTSVDLNWYIDTYHGSSYFQRWNRYREHSGGLSIHKSSHHFDLVNWWIDQQPEEVFAYGALNYYGSDSVHNPRKEDGRHCSTCDVKLDCPYYMRWNTRSNTASVQDDHIHSDMKRRQGYTGYRPDKCVFDSDITIEDTYTAVVKYSQGSLLNYSVNFSLPYEGYRLAINGTEGRLETMEYHAPSRVPFPVPEQTIDYFPLFGSKETIHVVEREGGHGGGDPVLQEDIFLGENPKRPYTILSGSWDGALAVAAGEAVWKSAHENQPVRVEDLLAATEGMKGRGD